MRPRGSSDSGRAFWRVPFVFRAIHERGRTSGASLNLHCVSIARIVRLPLRVESRYMLHALEALNSRYFPLYVYTGNGPRAVSSYSCGAEAFGRQRLLYMPAARGTFDHD